MTDTRSVQQRRRIMQSVGTKDTGPEWIVRRAVHGLGFRYRLHRRDLPGSPDLVFPSLKKVIFVHGCFWHGHSCRKGALPKSRLDYWVPKIEKNRQRDFRALTTLEDLGWKALVVWQCQTRDLEALKTVLNRFLAEAKKPIDVQHALG